jgi:hypothetical protein
MFALSQQEISTCNVGAKGSMITNNLAVTFIMFETMGNIATVAIMATTVTKVISVYIHIDIHIYIYIHI